MPELPDIVVYIEALERCIAGRPLEAVRVVSPFVVRTAEPPIRAAEGRTVRGLRRMGKRIVLDLGREDAQGAEGAGSVTGAPSAPDGAFGLDLPAGSACNPGAGDLFLVFHLMIAGRLHWKARGAKPPGRIGLAAFDFPTGTLLFTEASTRHRAALHLVQGEEALAQLARGGLEVLEADLPAFREALLRESHTLRRALTDPDLFSGIGNAFSDEILHRARLSPVKLTLRMDDAEIERLYHACRDTLTGWTARLRAEAGDTFPEKVTAFREGMAVHGRYRRPCPVCGSPVQRIVHAENETNYCATCQTDGRLLADRALSRLLRQDWPRSLEELDAHMANRVLRASVVNPPP